MTNLTENQIKQAKRMVSMSKMSQILENIRKVIAHDRMQKQPLILRINEGFIFNIARKAIEEDASLELKNAGSYEKLFESGFSFDTPDAIDLDLMKEHLIKLKNGEEIYSPLYDFVTCESKKDTVLKKPAKLILNEGLYVLHEKVRDIADVKIYVYTPFEVIKDRWFARATSRGKTGLAAQMQFHDVNQTAFRHIRPSMDIADVVINGMTTQAYIEEIVQQLIDAIVSVLHDKHFSL